jgi:hypothetical protein
MYATPQLAARSNSSETQRGVDTYVPSSSMSTCFFAAASAVAIAPCTGSFMLRVHTHRSHEERVTFPGSSRCSSGLRSTCQHPMALQRSRVVHALDGAAREQDVDLLDPLSASFFSSKPAALRPLQSELSDSSQHHLQPQPLSVQVRASSAQSPGPRLSFAAASPRLSSPAVSLQRVASSDDPLADLITLPLSPERFEAPAAAAAAASPAFSSPLAIELDEGISSQPPAFISQQEPLSPSSDEQLHTSVSPPRSAVAAAAAASFTAAQRLTGEETVMNLKNTALHAPNGRAYPGELIMTTYQLVFIPREGAAGGGFAHGFGHLKGAYFRVPLSSIDRIERERKSSARGAPPDLGVSISVYTKVSCLLLYRHCVQCVQCCYDSGHYMQCTSVSI